MGGGGRWGLQGLAPNGLCLLLKNSPRCTPMIWIFQYVLLKRVSFKFCEHGYFLSRCLSSSQGRGSEHTVSLVALPGSWVQRSSGVALSPPVNPQGLASPSPGRRLGDGHSAGSGRGASGNGDPGGSGRRDVGDPSLLELSLQGEGREPQ